MVARLKLKHVIEPEDATETMTYFNDVIKEFNKLTNVTENPIDLVVNVCLTILQKPENKDGVKFGELVALACECSEKVRNYVGDYRKSYRKLEPVLDKLVNYTNYIIALNVVDK